MENCARLIHHITTNHMYLMHLQEQYENNPLSRVAIYEEIKKTITELNRQTTLLNEMVKEGKDFWNYHALSNHKYIEVPNREAFLELLLALIKNTDDNYDIKKINVNELILKKTLDDSRVYHTDATILTDKESLKQLKGTITNVDLSIILKGLQDNHKSFIMSSNLTYEYPYTKEKIATSEGKDIIVSTCVGDTLDTCINKLVSFMTKYGSDLDCHNTNKMVDLINMEDVKTRKLTKRNYIKYNNEE